ncbi:aldehyde dehydrogenase, partial [Rhodococcus wratislaviensis IFP 2016]
MTDTTHSIEQDTTDAQLDRLLDAAAAAAPLWEDRTPHSRAAVLVAIA